MVLVVEGLNRRTASFAALSRAKEDGTAENLVERAARAGASEWALLSTCERMELLSTRPARPPAKEAAEMPFVRIDREAALHLFAVASGIESEIFGEAAVLGQVRRAYAAALERGTSGGLLGRVFHQAFRSARRVRAQLVLGEGGPDLPGLLVARLRAEGRSIGRLAVAVVGCGALGEAIVRAFRLCGTRVSVAGSDSVRTARLAEATGALPTDLERVLAELPSFDLLILASGRGRIITGDRGREAFEALPAAGGPEIWDLAVPRNLDTTLAALPGLRVRTEEDLLDAAGPRVREARRAEALRLLQEDAGALFTGGEGEASRHCPGEAEGRLRPAHAEASRATVADAPGVVSLVGAGPGDPALMTAAALDRLERAEVVLHDALLPTALLAVVPPRARLIAVGKRAGRASASQEEIARRMIAEARSGRRVVRLKGGDPLLFGRGGEEVESLERARIAWEVIPGITAACGAAASVGIPLTHRAFAHALRLVTGTCGALVSEEKEDEETLVVYMAGRRLAEIAAELLASGRSAETPVALIERATWPEASCRRLTLGELAIEGAPEGARTPALLIIGPAAARGRILPPPPRAGRLVLAGVLQELPSLAEDLRGEGASVLEIPLARVGALEDAAALRGAARDLHVYDAVRFGDPHTVAPWLEALREQGHDLRALAGQRLLAEDEATARALYRLGLRADGASPWPGERVLHLKGPQGKRTGDAVQAYDLAPMQPDLEEISAELRRQAPDAWLLASGAIASRFLSLLGDLSAREPLFAVTLDARAALARAGRGCALWKGLAGTQEVQAHVT